MKFEEAYSIYDNETLSIETIKTIYNQDPRAYIENYKFSFFCPECHLAQLSYINAVVPYFRAYPKAKHHENCDLQQDERSRKAAKIFVENDQNITIIQREMQSVLCSLFVSHSKHIPVHHSSSTSKTSSTTTHASHSSRNKRMGRKRIDLPFREEDYNCYKYFYGKAKIKWEYDKKSQKFRLLLRHIETNKFLGRIFVTLPVYGHLPSEYKTPTEYCCGIIFTAEIKNQEKSYFSTILYNSSYIMITKL